MTSKEWVHGQWSSGKSDTQIIEELQKGGWPVRKARTLLEQSYRERIFSAGFSALFSVSLLLIVSTLISYNETTLPLVWLFLLTLAGFYVVGTRYGRCRFRSVFFLLSAIAIWCGVLLLVLFSYAFLLQPFIGFTYSFMLAIVIGVGFGLATYAAEDVFHGFKIRLQGAGEKNARKVRVWSVSLGVVCALTLFLTYAMVTTAFISKTQLPNYRVQMYLDEYDNAMKVYEGIDNVLLREHFQRRIEGLPEVLSTSVTPSVGTVMQDTAIRDVCREQSTKMASILKLGSDVALAQRYSAYHQLNQTPEEDLELAITALGNTLRRSSSDTLYDAGTAGYLTIDPVFAFLFNVGWVPVRDVEECYQGMWSANTYAKQPLSLMNELQLISHETPVDLSDPQKRDIAAFIVWNAKQDAFPHATSEN